MYSRLFFTPTAVSATTATGLVVRRGLAAVATAASSSSSSSSSSPGNNRVVVLGSGWAGFQTALNMDPSVHLTVVSPNNHFVFTPLLPSASVGTLEGRVIQEPIRSVLGPRGHYWHAKARSVHPADQVVVCETVNQQLFNVPYDQLVIAVGVKTNTFGLVNIAQAAHDPDDCVYFLKQLHHARAIRDRIIEVFEMAALPTVTDAEKRRLLTFLVVGGGPTSCEFTAELHDFVKQDVKRLYKHLLPYVKIRLVEAGPALLGPFDKALQEYVLRLFHKRDIDVRLGTAVLDIEDYTPGSDDAGDNDSGSNNNNNSNAGTTTAGGGGGDTDVPFVFAPAKRALLSDGTVVPFGAMIWSAGLAPRTFTEQLDPHLFPRHARTKRLLVDDYLRVIGHEGRIWAIGDAAVNQNGVPLPQLAQVARQEGIYLADVLSGRQMADEKPFAFFSLGSMAFVGELKGIWDGSTAGPLRDNGPQPQQPPPASSSWMIMPKALQGLSAFFLWRFAYWGRQTSITNKILIPMYWFKAFLFGRDTSRY